MTVYIITDQDFMSINPLEDVCLLGYGYLSQSTAQSEADRLNEINGTTSYRAVGIAVRDYNYLSMEIAK